MFFKDYGSNIEKSEVSIYELDHNLIIHGYIHLIFELLDIFII